MRTPTPYTDVNQLLSHLMERLQTILGDNWVGLYLFGSLVAGDYEDALSDVDLMAALRTDLTDTEFAALGQMHTELAQNPRWDGRLEIAYLTVTALKTFKTQLSPIWIIAPGEPFHRDETGINRLVNWYHVRETSLTLSGPPPTSVIAPISKEEFLDGVRNYILRWRGVAENFDPNESQHHGSQAYAILTMCRGVYTLRKGESVSKKQSAAWMMEEFPAWKPLITDALFWRTKMHEYGTIPTPPLSETIRFVKFAAGQI